MPSLTTIGTARQGYTAVRGITSFTTKGQGLLIWSRHCLVYHGGVLLRELKDVILHIGAEELNEVTIDPLSDTRIMRGDFRSPGSKLIRYFARSGESQPIQNIELLNNDLNSESRAANPVASEFLPMDSVVIDRGKDPPLTSGAGSFVRAAGAGAVALPYPYTVMGSWFLTLTINFNDLLEADYCDRMIVRALSAGVVKGEMRFSLPRPSVPIGSILWLQVQLGMEFSAGISDINVLSEVGSAHPAACVNYGGFNITQLCLREVEKYSPHMKFMRLRDMDDSLAVEPEAKATRAREKGPINPLSNMTVRDQS